MKINHLVSYANAIWKKMQQFVPMIASIQQCSMRSMNIHLSNLTTTETHFVSAPFKVTYTFLSSLHIRAGSWLVQLGNV